jgi:polyisoprenoid-binding protein YceI
MKKTIMTLAAIALTTPAFAHTQSFDFKDPKGVNNAVFVLDAPLEAINGTASGISGTLDYNHEDPGALSGRIVIAADSLSVPNPTMREHMHGGQWLDVARFPEITFESTRVSNVKQSGNKVTAQITGDMTIRGETREVTAPVSFTYLKDKLGIRTNGQMQGDLLVLRARFTIKRSDFGINPEAPADKVAEEIELTLSLAGAAPAN